MKSVLENGNKLQHPTLHFNIKKGTFKALLL